jgi:hypothetical protein
LPSSQQLQSCPGLPLTSDLREEPRRPGLTQEPRSSATVTIDAYRGGSHGSRASKCRQGQKAFPCVAERSVIAMSRGRPSAGPAGRGTSGRPGLSLNGPLRATSAVRAKGWLWEVRSRRRRRCRLTQLDDQAGGSVRGSRDSPCRQRQPSAGSEATPRDGCPSAPGRAHRRAWPCPARRLPPRSTR